MNKISSDNDLQKYSHCCVETIFDINVQKDQIILINIPLDVKTVIFYDFLKIIMNSDNRTFVSFTETGSEFSLIINKKCIPESWYKLNINIHEDPYIIFEIRDTNECGIDHIGIVNKLSGLLKKKGISILYINSFNSNYILVKNRDKENAILALSSFVNVRY